MINLKTLARATESARDQYPYFMMFIKQDDEKGIMVVVIYNEKGLQVRLEDTFRDYSSYTPQLLKLCEKMEKITKPLEKLTDNK